MTRWRPERVQTAAPVKKKLTHAERCKAYREKIAQDPDRLLKMREDDKARAKQNRDKQKTEEVIQHERYLHRMRQRKYDEKQRQKKKAELASGGPVRPQTRLDAEKAEKKREANRLAVRRHRQNQSSQKKRRVNEKRMARYYREKEARLALQTNTQKGVRVQDTLVEKDSPYPNQESFKRAVRRVRSKIRAKGAKLAFLFKGLLKSADAETKQALKQVNISYITPQKTHPNALPRLQEQMASMSSKRDKNTLRYKRKLAEAFSDYARPEEVGLSKRFVSTVQDGSPYKARQENRRQRDIRDFFTKHAVENPCKAGRKLQLTKAVRELHREFVQSTDAKISLRSFFRHKPRNIASVNKLKFRQCLCEVCLNPKIKLSLLNSFLVDKCESVRCLLNESVCEFESVPSLLCVDRKCSECGVEQMERRLRESLGESLGMKMNWSRWELVRDGKRARVEKVRKSGSVSDCVTELVCELGPLCRHVFNAEWQRKQLQSLKENLPVGWCIATCDFAENFLCRFQDEPQSAHWSYQQVSLFPVVVSSRCAGCSNLRRDSLVFVIDDLRHDAHVVQVCVEQVLQYVVSIVPNLSKVVLVSDGCAAQFKSKLPFLLFSATKVTNVSRDVELEKVFFGSRHGKNDSDWLGGAVKRAVTRDIASGRVTIRNAFDMYSHCCRTQTVSANADVCSHKVRKFFFLGNGDIKRSVTSSMLSTVPGSRKIHHVRTLAPGVLATRQLTCFCTPCRSGQYHDCLSKDHVDAWDTVKLKYSGALPLAKVTGSAEGADSSSDSESDSKLPSQFNSEGESPVVSDSEGDGESDEEKAESPVALEADRLPATDTDTSDRFDSDARAVFFSGLGSELLKCKSFAEIQLVAQQWKAKVKEHELPSLAFLAPPGAKVDRRAWMLLEPDVQSRCFPLNVEGDGNCFFRSISLLLFGNESHHMELRYRTALVMAENKQIFLDGRHWCGIHDVTNPDDIINVAARTSVSSNLSPSFAFEEEVMAVIQRGAFVGLWVLFAASLMTGYTIQSVHPNRGYPLHRLHCNRIITAPGASQDQKMFIMWTSNHDADDVEHWLPNHFVPLVLKSSHVTGPRLLSFHKIMWNGKSYIGQVVAVDELLQLYCINFLVASKKDDLCVYSWPKVADVSWESLGSFQQEVTLQLAEHLSNQRIQFYTIAVCP